MDRARAFGSLVMSLFYTFVLALVIVLLCFTLVDKQTNIPGEEQLQERSNDLDAAHRRLERGE